MPALTHRLWILCKLFFIAHAYRAAGALIGEGVSNFVTDWDKVSATVSVRDAQLLVTVIELRTYNC